MPDNNSKPKVLIVYLNPANPNSMFINSKLREAIFRKKTSVLSVHTNPSNIPDLGDIAPRVLVLNPDIKEEHKEQIREIKKLFPKKKFVFSCFGHTMNESAPDFDIPLKELPNQFFCTTKPEDSYVSPLCERPKGVICVGASPQELALVKEWVQPSGWVVSTAHLNFIQDASYVKKSAAKSQLFLGFNNCSIIPASVFLGYGLAGGLESDKSLDLPNLFSFSSLPSLKIKLTDLLRRLPNLSLKTSLSIAEENSWDSLIAELGII